MKQIFTVHKFDFWIVFAVSVYSPKQPMYPLYRRQLQASLKCTNVWTFVMLTAQTSDSFQNSPGPPVPSVICLLLSFFFLVVSISLLLKVTHFQHHNFHPAGRIAFHIDCILALTSYAGAPALKFTVFSLKTPSDDWDEMIHYSADLFFPHFLNLLHL